MRLLGRVRVLAVSFREPVGGVEVAAAFLQLRSVLDIEDVDTLAAIYVADARQVSRNKGAIGNGCQVRGIVSAALVGGPAVGPGVPALLGIS